MTAARAVVLARGLGTRMRAMAGGERLTLEQQRAADAGMKAMMPVGQRPFLDFILNAIADGGVLRVAVVVAPDHDALRRYYMQEAPPARVQLELIVQPEPRGTADAVLCAERWVGAEPFLVMNGDNLYRADVIRMLAESPEPAVPGFDRDDLVRTSNIDAARIRAFALMTTDADGYLTSIVEKPDTVDVDRAALVSMNCWRFDQRIFQACRQVPRSPRGEYELPLAVGHAVAKGVRFRVLPARGPVLDLSQRTDAAAVSRRLASRIPHP